MSADAPSPGLGHPFPRTRCARGASPYLLLPVGVTLGLHVVRLAARSIAAAMIGSSGSCCLLVPDDEDRCLRMQEDVPRHAAEEPPLEPLEAA
jgi:hypothetical protein